MHTDHDQWTDARLAAWNAMTAADRAAEFDARVRAGYPLALIRPGIAPAPTTADDLRSAFIAGTIAFDAFEHSAAHPQFPLLVGPSAKAAPVPAAAPTKAPTAAPVVTAPSVPPRPPRDEAADSRAAWAKAVAAHNALVTPRGGR